MMKKVHLKTIVFLLLSLIALAAPDTSKSVTEYKWREQPYVAECRQASGTPITSLVPDSFIPLNSQYTFLKQSKVYNSFVNGNLQTPEENEYKQIVYKYFIKKSGNPLITSLQITNISLADGTETTQSIALSGTQYQFIDGSGPFCLFRQVIGGVNTLVLYSFSSVSGATDILKLDSQDLSEYSTQTFKQIIFLSSPEYSKRGEKVVALMKSIKVIASNDPIVVVRRLQDGLGFNFSTAGKIFQFSSQAVSTYPTYVNHAMAIQVTDASIAAYKFSQGQLELDLFVIPNAPSFFENHFVIKFVKDMTFATWDSTGENGEIFTIVTSQVDYAISLQNQKVTSAPANSLQYYSDSSSYIIELNLDPTVKSLFVVWADDTMNYYYNFMNKLGDYNNDEVIADFSDAEKISTSIFGYYSGTPYTSQLYIYIYKSTTLVKYFLQVYQSNGDVTDTITLNKMFSTNIDAKWKDQVTSESYQISTQLKCLCSSVRITSFICFYGTDGCTFTVESQTSQCEFDN